MRSMTGYGRALCSSEGISIVIEISSVNKRHLEININAPREWQRFEYDATKLIKTFIDRGTVRVSISICKDNESENNQSFKEEFIEKDINWIEKYLSKKGINCIPTPELILQLTSLHKNESIIPPLDKICSILEKALSKACKDLIKMRDTEGNSIKLDLLKVLKRLKNLVSQIEINTQNMVSDYREKLFNRLENSGLSIDQDDDRVLKEIALFAEKSDVSEEINRLKSHLGQMESTFESKGSIGRKIEFLVQEISRELNTLCSKSCRIESTNLTIEAKTEIEKLREQALNIE